MKISKFWNFKNDKTEQLLRSNFTQMITHSSAQNDDSEIQTPLTSLKWLGHTHLALRSASPAGLLVVREPTHSVSQSSVKISDFREKKMERESHEDF